MKEFIKDKIELFEITVDSENESVSQKIKSHIKYSGEKGKYLLLTVEKDEDIQEVVDFVYNVGGNVLSIIPRKQRLEDIFMEEIAGKGT